MNVYLRHPDFDVALVDCVASIHANADCANLLEDSTVSQSDDCVSWSAVTLDADLIH